MCCTWVLQPAFSSYVNRSCTQCFHIAYHCYLQRTISIGKECVNYFEHNCFIGSLYPITYLLAFLFASQSLISMMHFHFRVQRLYLFLQLYALFKKKSSLRAVNLCYWRNWLESFLLRCYKDLCIRRVYYI